VSLNSNGSYTYTPSANYHGKDRFVYRATNNTGGQATAAATITINPVEESPQIAAQEFATTLNARTDTVLGVVAASDPDLKQTLAYSITAGNTGSAFAIDAGSGTLRVSNPSGLNFGTSGKYQLTVRVTDNGAQSLTADATITVWKINFIPPATNLDKVYALNESFKNVKAVLNGGTGNTGARFDFTPPPYPSAQAPLAYPGLTTGNTTPYGRSILRLSEMSALRAEMVAAINEPTPNPTRYSTNLVSAFVKALLYSYEHPSVTTSAVQALFYAKTALDNAQGDRF
jgi:hypothetical protein